MRIRSIKPEFWTSDDIVALPWDTRLLFIGLWSYVDDNGVGRDNERLIVADLFPLEEDPLDTLAKVSRGLQELEERGQIARYVVDRKPYLYVNAWASHQKIDRPGKPRYPSLTSENAVPREGCATPSRQSRETPSPGAGEQGIREQGAGDQGGESADADDEPRADVDRICDHLADRIEANGSRRPTVTKKWRQSARLLLDRDQRTEEQVHAAIDWCQADDFWRGIILSLPKLREKYEQLRLAAERQRAGRAPKRGEIDWDAAAARAAARDAGHDLEQP